MFDWRLEGGGVSKRVEAEVGEEGGRAEEGVAEEGVRREAVVGVEGAGGEGGGGVCGEERGERVEGGLGLVDEVF